MPSELEDQEKQKEEKEEDFIKVPTASYDALLDGYDTLEAENKNLRSKKDEDDVDIDELLKDEKPQQKGEKVDLESMSNTELANFVFSSMEGVGKQIMQRLDTVQLTNEIERCMDKHDDFINYQKDIQKLSVANPKLSIERCYTLAKQEKGGFDKKEEEKGEEEKEKRSTAEKLYNLPKRKVYGEKPGVTPAATQKNTVMSSKEAASDAWDEVMARQGG